MRELNPRVIVRDKLKCHPILPPKDISQLTVLISLNHGCANDGSPSSTIDIILAISFSKPAAIDSVL